MEQAIFVIYHMSSKRETGNRKDRKINHSCRFSLIKKKDMSFQSEN
jgi:hypothetical protein